MTDSAGVRERLESIPAISRAEQDLGHGMMWGYRIHPIYKVRKFHYGMDFSAPEGKGVCHRRQVVKVKRLYNGYGKHIVIRHGFGYETLCIHLSKSNVRRGDKVKRGRVIGLVGSKAPRPRPTPHYGAQGRPQGESAHYYFNGFLLPSTSRCWRRPTWRTRFGLSVLS